MNLNEIFQKKLSILKKNLFFFFVFIPLFIILFFFFLLYFIFFSIQNYLLYILKKEFRKGINYLGNYYLLQRDLLFITQNSKQKSKYLIIKTPLIFELIYIIMHI